MKLKLNLKLKLKLSLKWIRSKIQMGLPILGLVFFSLLFIVYQKFVPSMLIGQLEDSDSLEEAMVQVKLHKTFSEEEAQRTDKGDLSSGSPYTNSNANDSNVIDYSWKKNVIVKGQDVLQNYSVSELPKNYSQFLNTHQKLELLLGANIFDMVSNGQIRPEYRLALDIALNSKKYNPNGMTFFELIHLVVQHGNFHGLEKELYHLVKLLPKHKSQTLYRELSSTLNQKLENTSRETGNSPVGVTLLESSLYEIDASILENILKKKTLLGHREYEDSLRDFFNTIQNSSHMEMHFAVLKSVDPDIYAKFQSIFTVP